MKKLMLCLMFLPSFAFAQNTIFCNPIGSMTACTDSRGNTTTITPLGAGMSAWSNTHGQGGTIVQPLPVPTTPTPVAPPVLSPPSPPVLPWLR